MERARHRIALTLRRHASHAATVLWQAVILRSLWKNHRLLPPSGTLASLWDSVRQRRSAFPILASLLTPRSSVSKSAQMMFIFVIYNSIYVPMGIAFFSIDKPLGQCILDVFIDVLFIIDIVKNTRTVYYDEEGQMVLDHRRIQRHYLCSSWFVIDFLAVFPFDVVASGGFSCGNSNDGDDAYTSVIKLLKALRLLRLVRFRKELDRLSGANALRVCVSLSIFLLVGHWLACIWWAVGYLEFKADERAALNGVPVACDSTRACSWLRRVPHGAETLSPDSDFAQQYVSSFFWSLTTLVKTPWVGPDTIAEKLVATFAVAAGAVFYASFLGTVQGSYASFNKADAQMRDKIENLIAFMNFHDISGDVRDKLVKHTTAQADCLPLGLSNKAVLQTLPSHLKAEVAHELYAESLGRPISMFPNVSSQCACEIVWRLQTQMVMADQVLISKDEVCSSLYFLVRGKLRATVDPPVVRGGSNEPHTMPSGRRKSSERRKSTSSMREFERPGSSVGFVEPLKPKCRGLYPVWVTASKQALLLTITQGDIAHVLNSYTADVEPLRQHLIKEHKAMLDSLQVTPPPGSPLARCQAEIRRALELEEFDSADDEEELAVTDEQKARVAALEVLVHNTLQRVNTIQKDAMALPAILKLVEEAAKDERRMRALRSCTAWGYGHPKHCARTGRNEARASARELDRVPSQREVIG
jgi:hypothetical protein